MDLNAANEQFRKFSDLLDNGLTVLRSVAVEYADAENAYRKLIARGSGSQRRYDDDDLVILSFIKALLDAGVSLQWARGAVARLREQWHLIEKGSTVRVLQLGPISTTVDLARLKADLDAAIDRADRKAS